METTRFDFKTLTDAPRTSAVSRATDRFAQVVFWACVGLMALFVGVTCGCSQPHTTISWGDFTYEDTSDKSDIKGLNVEVQRPDGTKIKAVLKGMSDDKTQANAEYMAAMAQTFAALVNKIPNVQVPGFVAPSPPAPAVAPKSVTPEPVK